MNSTVPWTIALPLVFAVAWLVFALIRTKIRLRGSVAENRQIARAVDGLDEVLLVTDADGLIEYCNASATHLIGIQRNALRGRRVYDFILVGGEAAQDSTCEPWPCESSSVDASIRNASGELIPVVIRRSAVRSLAGGYTFVSTRWAELFEAERKTERSSLVDTVTRLPNLAMARNRLGHLMAKDAENSRHIEFFVIELRRLDSVISVYGMATGDSVLRVIGERLAEIFVGQFVCHLGGGQFVALTVADDDTYGFSLALLVSDATMRAVQIGDHEFELGVSIGLSSYPADGDKFDVLLEHARNAAVSSDDVDDSHPSRGNFTPDSVRWRRSRIELELASACRTSQFHLVYQPQVDLRDSHVVGFEALIRWEHPRWGTLLPEEFIPIAEESGQVSLIDSWAIREVCRQRRVLLDEGVWDVPISVNIATGDLNNLDFESKLERALNEFSLSPEFLELELTEKSLAQVGDAAVRLLERLRQFGVRIALDDFGTGFCNLMSLKKLPVDRIKIDREFVRSLPDDEADTLVCKTVIELARSRKFDVVAEGVETAAQVRLLRSIGCDCAQGFLWPGPLEASMLKSSPEPRVSRMLKRPAAANVLLDMEATGIWRAS